MAWREAGTTRPIYARPAEFDIDYGVPLGLCEEDATKPWRFVREYTKASATSMYLAQGRFKC